MKRTAIAAHLVIPAVLAIGIFVNVLMYKSFEMEMFGVYVVGGYLFYAAPHLLWLLLAALGGFSDRVWHAGFVASSIALAAISAFWFFPRDPSGLPLQWMLYWPLAVGLQVVVGGGVALFTRLRSSKSGSGADVTAAPR